MDAEEKGGRCRDARGEELSSYVESSTTGMGELDLVCLCQCISDRRVVRREVPTPQVRAGHTTCIVHTYIPACRVQYQYLPSTPMQFSNTGNYAVV